MRRLLPVLSITAAAILLGFALAPACGDQCNKEADCATGEVCNAGVCESLSANYVHCASNRDCDPNGQFICRAGRCELKNTNVVIMTDSGVPPAPDTGMGPTDNGGGPTDNGMGPTDNGGLADAVTMDATSTIADGGPGTDAADLDGAPPGDVGGSGPMFDAGVPGAGIIEAHLDTDPPVAWSLNNSTITAQYVTGANVIAITGTGNVAGPIDGRVIRVTVPGNMPMASTCAGGAVIEWQDQFGNLFRAGNGAGTCVMGLISFGAVGGDITGTFSGTMDTITVGSPPPANMNPQINGAFNVTRGNDLP